jgi:hypothetical protein
MDKLGQLRAQREAIAKARRKAPIAGQPKPAAVAIPKPEAVTINPAFPVTVCPHCGKPLGTAKSKRKRGRPPTGKAVPSAERMRAYRARQR